MKNAAPWVAIALTLIAMIVSATVWFPTMAQDRVDAHAKSVDANQNKKIERLEALVHKLVTDQAVAKEQRTQMDKKLDKIIEKLDE